MDSRPREVDSVERVSAQRSSREPWPAPLLSKSAQLSISFTRPFAHGDMPLIGEECQSLLGVIVGGASPAWWPRQ
jgi:hypothetical protein